MTNNITALISAAETRESNVTAVMDLLSALPQPERVEVLVAALLRTSRVPVGISFGEKKLPESRSPTALAVSPVATTLTPGAAPTAFADEPVAAPAPSLPEAPRNPPKARPTARKGSGQEATRLLLPKEEQDRLLELVEKHPGSSRPWLAKQLGVVNPEGKRWRQTLQAAVEKGTLRKEGKDNKTRYFRGNDAGPE